MRPFAPIDGITVRQPTDRRGRSLIEMVVVIGILSTLLGLSVRTLAVVMQAEAGGVRDMARGLALSDLAARFRRDAHLATGAALPDGDGVNRLVLTASSGRRYVYVADEDGIDRTIEEEGEAVAHERYRPGPGTYRFEFDETNRLAALTFVRSRTAASGRPADARPERTFLIEAALGHRPPVSNSPEATD